MIAAAEPRAGGDIDGDVCASADALASYSSSSNPHHRQPRAGSTPNLYLGASVTEGGRRALGRSLIALPLPSRLLASPLHAAAPYARQGSDLWRRLHHSHQPRHEGKGGGGGGGGLLTTSRFADALGLREPRAARSLGGVPARLVGHGPLVEACRHLSGAAGEGEGEGDGRCDAAAAASAARLARRANARALWDANFGGGGGEGNGGSSTGDEDAEGAEEGEPQPPSSPSSLPHHHHRRQRRRDAASRRAAERGPSGVSMSYGLAQEWPSLYELKRVFPRSLLEESGLHLVAPGALLPTATEEEKEEAAGGARRLPPMGASPDAILAHAVRLDFRGAGALLRQWRARLPPALAEALLLRLGEVEEEVDDEDDEQARRLWSHAAPSFVASAGVEAARAVARRMWHDALRLVTVADDDSTAGSEEDGDEGDEGDGGGDDNKEGDEGAAAAALARELAAAASLLDALLAPGDPSRAFAVQLRRRRRRGGRGGAWYGSEDEREEEEEEGEEKGESRGDRAELELVARRAAYRAALERAMLDCCGEDDVEDGEEEEACGGGALPACCFVARRRSRSTTSTTAAPPLGYLLLREAVEIKNSSPYRAIAPTRGKTRSGGNGGNKTGDGGFLLNDPGPRPFLLPLWTPQAQLHCLATGLPSLLLMQRSATRGSFLWRVLRDDAYLQRAFALVRRLVASHVVSSSAVGGKARPPPHDCFFSEPGYGPFLAHTRRVALGAVRVAATRGSGGLVSEQEEEEGEDGGRRRRRRRRPRFPVDADRRLFVD